MALPSHHIIHHNPLSLFKSAIVAEPNLFNPTVIAKPNSIPITTPLFNLVAAAESTYRTPISLLLSILLINQLIDGHHQKFVCLLNKQENNNKHYIQWVKDPREEGRIWDKIVFIIQTLKVYIIEYSIY